MKLLTKTTLYYILLSVVVFLMGAITTYFILDSVHIRDTDEYFAHVEEKVLQHIKEGDIKNHKRAKHFIKLLDRPTQKEDAFSDTTFYYGKWEINFKRKTIVRKVQEKYYQIHIYKSMKDDEEETQTALYTIMGLFVALMLVLIIFNYFLSRKIWQPFNDTLQEIKYFSIHHNKPFKLQSSNIKEFRELNKLVFEMTDKIRKDYNNLKEFTENVSHEVQTPLAIIKNKLELLLESQNMDEEQSKMIHSAYNSASKLSKLSKTLTLITKIENQEFKNIQLIDFKNILETALYNFQELIELKDITLVQDLSEEVLIRIDPLVADMLVANLLKNAIKHNFEQGLIRIQLNKKQFIIANTGCPPKVDTETLFHRFQKNNPSSDSLGLGLAIVKKICDVNEFQIHYTFEADLHSIVIDF